MKCFLCAVKCRYIIPMEWKNPPRAKCLYLIKMGEEVKKHAEMFNEEDGSKLSLNKFQWKRHNMQNLTFVVFLAETSKVPQGMGQS